LTALGDHKSEMSSLTDINNRVFSRFEVFSR
jgi:hypothetical protein